MGAQQPEAGRLDAILGDIQAGRHVTLRNTFIHRGRSPALALDDSIDLLALTATNVVELVDCRSSVPIRIGMMNGEQDPLERLAKGLFVPTGMQFTFIHGKPDRLQVPSQQVQTCFESCAITCLCNVSIAGPFMPISLVYPELLRLDGTLSLQSCDFDSRVDMGGLNVRNQVWFRDVTLKMFRLYLSECQGQVTFENTECVGDFEITNVSFENCLILKDCHLKGAFRLVGSEFERGFSFPQCSFGGDIDLRVATANGAVEFPHEYWKPAWYSRCRRRLKGMSTPDVEAMGVDGCTNTLFRRWVQDENYLIHWRLSHSRALYRLWWATSDCGRSLLHWVIFSAIVVFAFALLYNFSVCFPQSLELSINAFLTTLGFASNIAATGWVFWVVVLEKIAGFVMLAALISIFGERMIRKS